MTKMIIKDKAYAVDLLKQRVRHIQDELTDTDRDNTVLPLIRGCIERKMPLLGVCRGIQEMNIAMGGTLYYRVNEVEGKNDHRMPRGDDVTQEEVFQLRHLIALTPGGLFQQLAQADEVKVNSLHGQAIDRIADAYNVEATTVEDNIIEGIRLKNTLTTNLETHIARNSDLATRRHTTRPGEQSLREISW